MRNQSPLLALPGKGNRKASTKRTVHSHATEGCGKQGSELATAYENTVLEGGAQSAAVCRRPLPYRPFSKIKLDVQVR